jgi:hypothetical protein
MRLLFILLLILSSCASQQKIQIHPTSPPPDVLLDMNACAQIAFISGYMNAASQECIIEQKEQYDILLINHLLDDCETRIYPTDTIHLILEGVHKFRSAYNRSHESACSHSSFSG